MEMTLIKSAERSTRPWFSLDAMSDEEPFEKLPQQSIDICLMCEHCASYCDNCREWSGVKQGRPQKEIDTEKLLEMMKLKRCNKDICKALGVSERTLQRIKKAIS